MHSHPPYRESRRVVGGLFRLQTPAPLPTLTSQRRPRTSAGSIATVTEVPFIIYGKPGAPSGPTGHSTATAGPSSQKSIILTKRDSEGKDQEVENMMEPLAVAPTPSRTSRSNP